MEKLNSFRGKLSLVLAIGKPHVIKKIVDSINNPDIDSLTLLLLKLIYSMKTPFLWEEAISFVALLL